MIRQQIDEALRSIRVIGAIGSRDWIHSTHGRKIERAVELREQGTGIYILSEEYWADSIRTVL